MTLFQEIANFLKRSGMSDTAFGKTALGDPAFLGKWKRGEIRVGPRRQITIRLWLHENRELKVDRSAMTFEASATGVNVAQNPDLWKEDATIASDMLAEAIRLHHPDRCAV